MKQYLFIILIIPTAMLAQEPANTNIKYQDGIGELLEMYSAYNKKYDKVDGFRIQIMFSNDKQEAYGNKVKLYKEFPGINCYLDYEQPYYKLKMGDYKDRFEANYFLQQVLPVYPGAFIVKDKITANK
jgi:hypothetical protein